MKSNKKNKQKKILDPWLKRYFDEQQISSANLFIKGNTNRDKKDFGSIKSKFDDLTEATINGKFIGNQANCSSYKEKAIIAFKSDHHFLNRLRQKGKPWRGVLERLKKELPKHLHGRGKIAHSLVPEAMNAIFGQQDSGWETIKKPSKSGSGYTVWIVIIKSVPGKKNLNELKRSLQRHESKF